MKSKIHNLILDILKVYLNTYKEDLYLCEQLNHLIINEIKYTGIGFFANFSLDIKNVKPLTHIGMDKFPLEGPQILSSGIATFGETLLWQKDGYISSLEIFTSGNFMQECLDDYKIKLM
jgi:hypothetical protein